MAETLFAFDAHNYRTCQTLFRGARKQEYYLGDYSIEPGPVIDVRAERKAIGAISIIRLTSRTRLGFRRTRAHIRADGADLTVLYFIKRGRLSVSNQNGAAVGEPGDLLLTRSRTPFLTECQVDEEMRHEALHVTAPTHIVREFLSDDVATGFRLPAGRREFAIAETILLNLLEDEGEMAPDTAEMLIRTALSSIGHAIRDRNVSGRLRQTVSARRLAEVLRFIEVNLANPNLSTSMVASGCGISPRYLSFLLKHHGASFSTLVWEQRLSKAQSWLASSSADEVSIGEIAYSVGFKSPAHFSRMFKRTFQVNPRDCRQAHAAGPADALQPQAANLGSAADAHARKRSGRIVE
jgi:AraC-like DNA-binding protein